jgi:hypothetical protein
MRDLKMLVLIAAVAALSGCVTTAGIVPLNHSTYMTSAEGGMGMVSFASLESLALEKARAFCAGRHERMVFVRVTHPGHGFTERVESDVTFRCVADR